MRTLLCAYVVKNLRSTAFTSALTSNLFLQAQPSDRVAAAEREKLRYIEKVHHDN